MKTKRTEALHLNAMLYHCSAESHRECLPSEWYEKAFPKIKKLSHLLNNVDLIDGRLFDIRDESIIIDDHIANKMHTFKSLARVFIGSPSVQKTLKNNMVALSAGKNANQFDCFSKPSERDPMIVNSLSKVSNFLNVSAQQRKLVRLTVCPQVTQHRIWTATLEEVLNGLKFQLDYLHHQCPNKGIKMGQQIVSSCLKFLSDKDTSNDLDSTSWMRLAPVKTAESYASQKWDDVLEMFNDLIEYLKSENELVFHVTKLEVMKEGLSQIKDVLVDKSIGYKEAKHQESLVQKKLTKTLGYSSKCLFTLLLYYLYGHVRDIEIDICGGVYGSGGDQNKFCLCMGRILTSNEEKMVWNGIKQLDKALGVFKFVWETAGMKGVLNLQGHLWCVGAEARMFTYKGNMYFLHGMSV